MMKRLLNTESPADISRVLVMSHFAIGDWIYHAPWLKAFKNKYPNAKVDIWLDDCRRHKKHWHAGRSEFMVQWLKNESFIDTVFPIALDEEQHADIVQQASSNQYDLIVFCASKRIDKFIRVAKQISNNARLFGNRPSSWLQRLLIRVLDKNSSAIKLHEEQPYSHVFERNQRFYEHVFGELPLSHNDAYGLHIDPSNHLQAIREFLASKHLDLTKQLVVVNPFSTSEKRDLNWDTLSELTSHLVDTHSCNVILTVPPSLYAKTELALQQRFSECQQVAVFTAKQDYLSLPAMLKQADLIITVETAVMHIASVMGLKQLALVREKAKGWHPLRADRILWSKLPLSQIRPHELINDLDRLLGSVSTSTELGAQQPIAG